MRTNAALRASSISKAASIRRRGRELRGKLHDHGTRRSDPGRPTYYKSSRDAVTRPTSCCGTSIIDMEGRTGPGPIAPIECGMFLRALLESVEGVIGTYQAERIHCSHCIGVVIGLARSVPPYVIVQISSDDRRMPHKKALVGAERLSVSPIAASGAPDLVEDLDRADACRLEGLPRPQNRIQQTHGRRVCGVINSRSRTSSSLETLTVTAFRRWFTNWLICVRSMKTSITGRDATPIRPCAIGARRRNGKGHPADNRRIPATARPCQPIPGLSRLQKS